jgi:hypothetical protein
MMRLGIGPVRGKVDGNGIDTPPQVIDQVTKQLRCDKLSAWKRQMPAS